MAVSYIGVAGAAEPNAQYSQAVAVRVVVCINISIQLYCFTAHQLQSLPKVETFALFLLLS